jgi:tRNA threonylcarbamoyladenosine biosynthesis protein TsaB
MNLLAIDTSTEKASVALFAQGVMTCEEQDGQKTQAQILLPLIDKLMVNAGLRLNQLDGIVFGCGPGSFTGLRVSCSMAKGLAYAHDLDLIPVSSLAAIAWSARKQINDLKAPVLAVLDARMHELYWAYFGDATYSTTEQVSKAAFIELPETPPVVLAGVGIEAYWTELSESIKAQTRQQLNVFPSAVAMIEMACALKINPISVALAQPVYIRNQVTQGDTRG